MIFTASCGDIVDYDEYTPGQPCDYCREQMLAKAECELEPEVPA